MWIWILGECSHFCRSRICVVTHYMLDKQGICNTVWQVVVSAQLVSHGVADSKESIGECHACKGRGICHFFSCDRISGTIFICGRQVVKDQFGRL